MKKIILILLMVTCVCISNAYSDSLIDPGEIPVLSEDRGSATFGGTTYTFDSRLITSTTTYTIGYFNTPLYGREKFIAGLFKCLVPAHLHDTVAHDSVLYAWAIVSNYKAVKGCGDPSNYSITMISKDPDIWQRSGGCAWIFLPAWLIPHAEPHGPGPNTI